MYRDNYSYLQSPDKRGYSRLIEEGEYIATLNFKVWGKRMSLGCYFETDDGKKFYLYAWRIQYGERKDDYCPRDCAINFRDVKPGTRWLIKTRRSSKGNVYWSTAEELLSGRKCN